MGYIEPGLIKLYVVMLKYKGHIVRDLQENSLKRTSTLMFQIATNSHKPKVAWNMHTFTIVQLRDVVRIYHDFSLRSK